MVPGTRTKKLRILQNRCLTGNQEPNQEVQALISWVDQEVIGLTRIFLAFYKKLLFFFFSVYNKKLFSNKQQKYFFFSKTAKTVFWVNSKKRFFGKQQKKFFE